MKVCVGCVVEVVAIHGMEVSSEVIQFVVESLIYCLLAPGELEEIIFDGLVIVKFQLVY